MIGLLATGGIYAAATSATSADAASQSQLETITEQGEKLFIANCATCHGPLAEGTEDGPSLVGVGAASVDFQVGTGRMPMAAQGPQAEGKPVQFTDEQIHALATWVATLAPGPAVPTESELVGDDIARGGELYRINCAMCHNVAGAGGALTEGKFAPALMGVESKHIYEAMLTGPQNMPVFNNANISPADKANIISYLKHIEDEGSPGGFGLGNLGPVSEGLFVWIFVVGGLVGITVWLTAKSN